MAEEVASSSNPDKPDIPLPKVLVHQASESDKGEDSTNNDVPVAIDANGLENNHAQDVNSETENVNSSLNKNVADVEATEPDSIQSPERAENEEKRHDQSERKQIEKSDPIQSEEKIAGVGITVESVIKSDENDWEQSKIATTEEAVVISSGPLAGDEETQIEEDGSLAETAKNQKETSEVTADKTKQKEDLPNTETAERLKTKMPELSPEETAEEGLSSFTLDQYSLEAAENPDTKAYEESPTDVTVHHSLVTTEGPFPKSLETTENPPETEKPSAQNLEADEKTQTAAPTHTPSHESISEQEPSQIESLTPPATIEDSEKIENLLEMVANGKTELIAVSEIAIPDEQSDGSNQITIREVGTDESNEADEASAAKEAPAGLKSDAVEELTATEHQDEEASVSSDEKVDGENHYDASVSGNEDDAPEQISNKVADSSTPPHVAIPAEKLAVESLNAKNCGETSQEMKVGVEKTGDSTAEQSITSKLDSVPTIKSLSVPSPARSPKMVKFSSDTKPITDSNSDSEAVIHRPIESKLFPQDQVADLDVNSFRQSIASPEPYIMKLRDLEEREGMESPPIEDPDEDRREGSSSKLSNFTDESESRTVVEHEGKGDSPDLAASAAQEEFEQYKHQKESETGELKQKIVELEDEISRFKVENTGERQKVADMGVQMKKMTDDSTDNVKTIAARDQKIRTLEDQIEKLKTTLAHHEQQRNGTAPAPEKTGQAKKSSVCAIL